MDDKEKLYFILSFIPILGLYFYFDKVLFCLNVNYWDINDKQAIAYSIFMVFYHLICGILLKSFCANITFMQAFENFIQGV